MFKLPLSLFRFRLTLVFCLLATFTNSVLAADAETVVRFNSAAYETPESIQFDRHGNMYVSMALTGEIRKIAADGTQQSLAFMPLRPDVQPCQNSFALPITGALALDHQGNIYVSVNSCNLADLGIWKVTPGGEASLLAQLPAASAPNGIAYHGGWLYVADTTLGAVWRIHSDGAGGAQLWTNDSLLAPVPLPLTPGPNGIQVFHEEVYVSVSSRAHVVAFPIRPDGSAGTGRVHADDIPLDDFAFDVKGNLYGTTDPFNTVVKITPDGTVTELLTTADGLDGPTAAAFGVGGDNKNLYITNASFPFFHLPGDERRPGIMRLSVGIAGKPRP